MTVHHLHCVLRPDANGQWYVQNDATHASYGIDAYVQQTSTYVRIYTAGLMLTKAGTIQISSDDGFGDAITGHANLGINTAFIKILADGCIIDPADVWCHLPPDRQANMNGNFWINMTMIE